MIDKEANESLPKCAAEYIDLVVKKMGYRRKVRAEVREELAGHFADALHGVTDEQLRVEKAMSLIKEFGEPKTLAKLIRRGKKRCRPLWLKALIRTCQVFGIIILLIVIRLASLFGTPGHATDYYAKLNALVRGRHDDSQNAQPLLDEAAAAMVPIPEWLWDRKYWAVPPDMNDQEYSCLEAWLESNTKSLELMRSAASMPSRWVTFNHEPADPNLPAIVRGRIGGVVFPAVVVEQMTPSLSAAKSLVYVLRWQSSWEVHTGRSRAAIEDALTMTKLAFLYYDSGILIDQLVGIAIEAMSEDQLRKTLGATECDGDTLKYVESQLQQLYREHPATLNFKGEKVFCDNAIQSSYTEGGRILIGGLAFVVKDWPAILKGLVLGFPSKAESQEMVDDFFAVAERMGTKTPWQKRVEGSGDEDIVSGPGSMTLELQGSALAKASELTWRVRVGREATLAVLAIERYRLEKGSLPASLDELVKSGYLAELPMDPWSDGPLVYRKTADGYTLYSVGEDFIDNGGKPRPTDIHERGKGGWDWVFWPAAK